MKINNSIEWHSVRNGMVQIIMRLPFNTELRKMLKNIDSMVDELSKHEVNSRRNKSSEAKEYLLKVNHAIDTLEQWIMMASFLK